MVSAAMKEERLKAAKERPKVVKVADIDKAQKEKLAAAMAEEKKAKETEAGEEEGRRGGRRQKRTGQKAA